MWFYFTLVVASPPVVDELLSPGPTVTNLGGWRCLYNQWAPVVHVILRSLTVCTELCVYVCVVIIYTSRLGTLCFDTLYLDIRHSLLFIILRYVAFSHLCLDKFHSLLFIILRYFVFWRFMFGHTSFLVDIAITFGTSRSETSYLDRLHSLFFILRSFFIFLHFIFGYISFLVGIN